jgi:SAM-dependent methyltransferase
MDRRTRAQLRALNRRFYAEAADAFAATRGHAWPGWERLPLPAGASARRLRVLDVGCGNARLAAWLRTRLGCGFAYLGADASERMLEHARTRLATLADVGGALVCADVLEHEGGDPLPRGDFDFVCAFGLLHHVPGLGARRALVAALAARVAPGGVLALSAWQFADRARFAARLVPWSAAADRFAPPLDPASLEPGDHLLGFADQPGALRYAHHCDEAELDALAAAAAPLRPLPRFSADGRSGDLNLYLVLVRDAVDER